MNNRQRKPLIFVILALFCITLPVSGQESNIKFNVTGSVDWVKAELRAEAGFELAEADLRLPTGRFMGEEILKEAYPRLIRPYILPLRVDSNSTIKTLLDNGELTLDELDTISRNADSIPPALSPDLTRMNGKYTVFLDKISASLGKYTRMAEPERPLRPIPTADYTGIIIIADNELPIHGRRAQALAEPCLFPKIWDTEMNTVYDRNIFTPDNHSGNLMVHYTVTEEIFKPTPSGLEGELAALAGPYPLRILAREVFGINPVDLVIYREDALKILSNDNNRRLLREGRVVIVLNREKLAVR